MLSSGFCRKIAGKPLKHCQNRIVFSGSKRNVLLPGLGEMWFQNLGVSLGVRLPRFEAKTTLCFYSGFKRDVLTPGVSQK